MDADAISDALELLSTHDHARARGREVDTLRGLRGTPDGEVARIAASTWLDSRPKWPRDRDELDQLFGTALEDGLVAIALLGGLLVDDPAGAYELGLDWLEKVDDVLTADALGTVILGPGLLATGAAADLLAVARAAPRPHPRRAAVLAALPATGRPVKGPCMSVLRERSGEKHIRFVAEPRTDILSTLMSTFVRDTSPVVHKGLRRVLREWRKADKAAATDWANNVPGGIPKTLRAELGGNKR